MPKRKLLELTLDKKKEVLDRIQAGRTCRQVAEEFAVSKSTVSKISTSKEEILRAWEENGNSKRKRLARKTEYENINAKVLEFFVDCRSKNIPVSGPMLQEAALSIARNEGESEFKASNGWLAKFRERHAIEFKALSGEAAELDTAAAEEWLKRIPDITRGYNMKDIFNADETALFYRQIPKKSLVTKMDKCKGGKLAKERVTVLLCCSALGEKLKPLVIGHAAQPRAFRKHRVKLSALPVHWTSNRKAWMTSAIFNDWLSSVNKKMKLENRHVLIIVDNAPSHTKVKNLPNVQVKFLPPNLTSAVQPLDQGIIQAAKLHYRRLLLSSMVSNACNSSTVSEYLSKVTVLDAIWWLAKSWNNVRAETIQRCFTRCGLAEEIGSSSDNIEDEDATQTYDYFQEMFGLVNRDEYGFLDQDVEVHDCNTGTSETSSLYKDPGGSGQENDCHSDTSEDDIDRAPRRTLEDALNAFRVLEDYAHQSLPQMSSEVADLRLKFDSASVRQKIENTVQSKITAFLL